MFPSMPLSIVPLLKGSYLAEKNPHGVRKNTTKPNTPDHFSVGMDIECFNLMPDFLKAVTAVLAVGQNFPSF